MTLFVRILGWAFITICFIQFGIILWFLARAIYKGLHKNAKSV